jgi:transcriptional regulator NrdR family protein
MLIVKRDGHNVVFDARKIVNAINKAFEEVDG